jgi:hypothetical protein
VGWFKTVIRRPRWIFVVTGRGGKFVLVGECGWMISLSIRIGVITFMGEILSCNLAKV